MARSGVGIQIHGEKELMAALEQFRGSVQRRIVKKAVTAGARPVLRAIKDRAKFDKQSGTLWKSIGTVIRGYPKGAGSQAPGRAANTRAPTWLAYIGPRRGMGRHVTVSKTSRGKTKWQKGSVTGGRTVYRDPVKYAHLVERGTVRSRPMPFMRPGWDQSRNAALSTIAQEIRAGIDREAATAASKTKRTR